MNKITLFTSAIVGALLSISTASYAQTLNVYTYDSFSSEWGPGPKIKENFEKDCQCTVNFITVDSSAGILSRVQLEGASSDADVVLGLDLNLMERAKATGLLMKHGVDTSEVAIPGGWKDPFFVPFDQGYFSFIYNSEKLKNPPSSLKDVVENQNLRVIYQDPRTSTPGFGLLLWMKAVYGDQAKAAWETLAKHTVTVSKSWYDGYSLFLKGESDLVLSYTTSPAYHMIEEGVNKYKAVKASEGFYPQIEVAAMLKNAPHPKLAERFMAFILKPGFQSTMATGNWMYPVMQTGQPLPEAFATLPAPTKVLTLPSETVTKNRREWVNEWLEATTR